MGLKLGLIRLRQRLRRDKLGLYWLFLALIGFVLGLNWVCFPQVSNWIYFHNALL